MARLMVAIFAVVVLTVAGLVSSYDAAPLDTATSAAAAAVPSFGPTASDDQIGTAEDDGSAVHVDEVSEAPVGGTVSPGDFLAGAPADSPSQNGGSAVQASSAMAGVVAFAAAGFFF